MENKKFQYKVTKLVTKTIKKTSGIKRNWASLQSFHLIAQA